jgi:chemotaxis protein CheX
MDEQFIYAFVPPLSTVLATMVMIEARALPPQGKAGHRMRGEITGLIDLVEEQANGSPALSFHAPVVFEVMQRLFGEVPDTGDDSIGAMAGEITNMVTGGAKILLSELGFEFRMSVPKVITGTEHEITRAPYDEIVEIPFETEHGRIHLDLSFTFNHQRHTELIAYRA